MHESSSSTAGSSPFTGSGDLWVCLSFLLSYIDAARTLPFLGEQRDLFNQLGEGWKRKRLRTSGLFKYFMIQYQGI